MGEKEEEKKAKEIKKGYASSGYEELSRGTAGREFATEARGISEPSKKKEKPPPPE